MKLPMAGAEAIGLLRELRPTLVASVGGYAAGPVTMCASVMGIATVLLEQNSVPGVTNRALGKVVKRAFLTYEASQDYFPQNRSVLAGNPLRQELATLAAHTHYQAHQVTKTQPLRLLILGGSGGSLALNRLIPDRLLQLPQPIKACLHITHQVGGQGGEATREAYARRAGEFAGVTVVEFIEEMAATYAQADLLICRAGATTIAEVLAFGLPAIYVPFPGAADDHQRTNAQAVVQGGAGLMLAESDLEGPRLGTPSSGADGRRPKPCRHVGQSQGNGQATCRSGDRGAVPGADVDGGVDHLAHPSPPCGPRPQAPPQKNAQEASACPWGKTWHQDGALSANSKG